MEPAYFIAVERLAKGRPVSVTRVRTYLTMKTYAAASISYNNMLVCEKERKKKDVKHLVGLIYLLLSDAYFFFSRSACVACLYFATPPYGWHCAKYYLSHTPTRETTIRDHCYSVDLRYCVLGDRCCTCIAPPQ